MLIPYCPISKDRKDEIEKTLCYSNKILEHYHSLITKRQGRLGFITFKNEKLNKINLLSLLIKHSKNNKNKDFIINNFTIPYGDLEKIIFSKSLEWEILSSFSPMFIKIINKWKNASSDICLNSEDLESEAIRLAISSIYTFDGTKSLSNYIYICVSRGIKEICKKTNPLSKIGTNALKIYYKFEKTKSNLPLNATFDDIIESAKFTKKQIKILQSISVTVSSQAAFDDENNRSLDYTFLGKKFSGVDGKITYNCKSTGLNSKFGFTVTQESHENSDISIDENFETDLSQLEKIVLKGFLESPCSIKKLGINSLAKNIINPKTNKPYSRMAITYAWRRVKEKLGKKLKVA